VGRETIVGWFNWAFEAGSTNLVAGWGFWAGIVGLVLTIVGFGVTIVQLHKTRSAADAAKAEAKRLQQSIAKYDYVNEATRASTALVNARNYVKSGLWSFVPDSYETVRGSLEALKSETTDANLIAKIEDVCRFIQNLCDRVERDIQNEVSTVSIAKTISVIREHKLLIDELAREAEKRVVQ
jgi:hypothetical protein